MNKRDFLKSFALMGATSISTLSVQSFSFAKESDKSINTQKEAMFYHKEADSIICDLCPHFCRLKEGQTGICKTRKVIDGKLMSLVYGKSVAVHLDPVEKKPFYHYLPSAKVFSMGTAGCNFQCMNCQNWEISQKSPLGIPAHDYSPNELVQNALSYEAKCMAYTYTEPTVFYEYMLDTAVLTQETGLKNLIISNGYINKEPLEKLLPFIDAANIDLKSFDDAIYRKLCGGSLQAVLDTLKQIKDSETWLEITYLIVPSYSDNLEDFRKMCKWLINNGFENTPLHISRFFPAYKLQDLYPTKFSVIEEAFEIALEEGIQFVYIGNVKDTKKDSTYCPKCGSLLIERNGYSTEIKSLKDGKCSKCGLVIPGTWG